MNALWKYDYWHKNNTFKLTKKITIAYCWFMLANVSTNVNKYDLIVVSVTNTIVTNFLTNFVTNSTSPQIDLLEADKSFLVTGFVFAGCW